MFFLVILCLCSWIATAAADKYTITYGNEKFICHTTFDLAVTVGRYRSPAYATTVRAYCVFTHEEGVGTFYLPVSASRNPQAVNMIADLLGPANELGHYGVQIIVRQPVVTFAGQFQIPAFSPRFTMYFDSRGTLLGPCEYQQTALQLVPGDGAQIQPSRCPFGTPEVGRLGRWFSCFISCSRY
ncbi:hypothetical protein CTRI78_v007348 [Colletotrichum trifolii]|uniref:Uncharacterized protein n=1 Tax=Colletotrichum trifolii TaxID=5466 RepID=A0A4V3HVE1_COLTR|nr:hypothetical protein CTRI78_v007348 [Colletotrichum trifolii]